jgi:hypothetical protein
MRIQSGHGKEQMQGTEWRFTRYGETEGIVAGKEFVFAYLCGGIVNGL